MLSQQLGRELDRFASKSSDFSSLVGAFRAYISPLIVLIGVAGNLLIIALFYTEGPRTRFSIFTISLAVTHTISLIMNTALDDFLGRGLYYLTDGAYCIKLDATSTVSCKILEYLPNTMYFIASYLMVVFSLDRVLTTYMPLKYRAYSHRKWAILTCLLVTLFGLVGNIPGLVVQNLKKDEENQYAVCCMDRSRAELADFAIIFRTVVTFIIPVVLVLALDFAIVLQLWRAHCWRLKNGSKLLPGALQEFKRATGHLGLSACFLLLYLPLGVLVLMRLHITVNMGEETTSRAIRVVNLSKFFSSLKDISYAVNCFIYAICLPKFRRNMLQIFRCK